MDIYDTYDSTNIESVHSLFVEYAKKESDFYKKNNEIDPALRFITKGLYLLYEKILDRIDQDNRRC